MPIKKSASSKAEGLIMIASIASEKLIETARVEAQKLVAQGASPIVENKLLLQDIAYIKQDIAEIKVSLGTKFVTQEEFKPVKNIVYGMVGLFLSSIVVAIITLVIK